MKSIVEKEPAEACYLCGTHGPLERHHIFGGIRNRKWSEKYGLTVHLCPRCHRDGKEGVHADAKKAAKLYAAGEAAFEREYGREKFKVVFGRYYTERSLAEAAQPEGEKTQKEGKGGFILLDDV